MYPVCDQGFLIHPSGVELVGAIRTPEPDQNHPVKDRNRYLEAKWTFFIHASRILSIACSYSIHLEIVFEKGNPPIAMHWWLELDSQMEFKSPLILRSEIVNFNFSSTPKKRRDACQQQDIFVFGSSWHWTLNLSRLEYSCDQIWYWHYAFSKLSRLL